MLLSQTDRLKVPVFSGTKKNLPVKHQNRPCHCENPTFVGTGHVSQQRSQWPLLWRHSRSIKTKIAYWLFLIANGTFILTNTVTIGLHNIEQFNVKWLSANLHTFTSHARKKIMEMKKTNPRQDGRLSSVRYMMKTQPSWLAASYTVKKLVAAKID